MLMRNRAGLCLTLVCLAAHPAFGQEADEAASPAVSLELIAGYAGFVDDAMIDHGVIGGAARVHLSPRIAMGPEIVYMRGPGHDRDLFLTGVLTFDLMPPRAGRPPRVSPFFVVGGGIFRHRNRVGTHRFSHLEAAATGGGGARVWIGQRLYTAIDLRLGWELHWRVNGTFGVALWR